MRPTRAHAPRRGAEAGVAAITAVLIVAVAASAAAFMLAQQSATLDQAMLVASRAQADQYAQAGIDWARGVVAEDALTGGAVDSLAEGWAQPIAGLPVERALVSGVIDDEQGKFNLNNLVDPSGHRSAPDVAIFERLLASLGLSPSLADAVVDWIDLDDIPGPNGAENAYYLSLPQPYLAANAPMVQVEELYRVKGFDAPTVAALKPYVSALPARTAINANTASALVLAAALPGIPPAAIAERVKSLAAKPFTDTQSLASWAAALDPAAVTTGLDVKTSFFDVRVQVAQDDVQLASEALVQRTAGTGGAASTAIIWRRPLY